MPRVTYTAIRELERTGFSVLNATDVSAAAGDDSFNASTTSLSGVASGDWLYVSGFANAANNGWFRAGGASTSSKILTLTPTPTATHLRLPGVNGNSASTPDSVANSVTGNIDVRIKLSMDDWTPAVDMTLAGKWESVGQRSWFFAIGASVYLYYSLDGSTLLSAFFPGAPFANGATGWLRFTRDATSGEIKCYNSSDGASWTQLGSTVAGTAGNLHESTQSIRIGAFSASSLTPLAGRVYYWELRNGIDGTVVSAFDPTRGTVGAASFVATTGETWTVNTSGTPPALLQGRALVTESAGPAVSITGHKRGYGQSYSIDFEASAVDPTDTDTKNRVITWGGRAESILLRQERSWMLRTLPLAAAAQAQWREFLASVAASEEFTLDPLGTLASPVAPFQAELLTSTHAPKRVGVSAYVTYDFKAREL